MPVDTNLNPYGVWVKGASNRLSRSPHENTNRGGGSNSRRLSSSSPQPSLYGALPYVYSNPLPIPDRVTNTNTSVTPAPQPGNLTTFCLTSPSPYAHTTSVLNVLNCSVLDARNSHVHYTISTDNSLAGYTVFKSALEKISVGLIEWGKGKTSVEVRGAVPKQETKAWLRVSRDQTYRTMTVRGFQYVWSPDNQYINLSSAASPTPTFLGRISRGDETVVIELTPDAVQLGLQDASIVAAVLLLCGQRID
ncbi:hypothetical protein R3P38DRAFT_3181495 [Favolaschia claudopus]|uniref:DUF6593 domain-containing protein n=1 Tax=Favolaschia claudopus TaxID=2862362 RepID=A0AAW0CLH2_9AGAR